jgi:hypothetical protein
LRWAQVLWYTYQVSLGLVQVFKSFPAVGIHRQHGDLISPFLFFFKIKKVG